MMCLFFSVLIFTIRYFVSYEQFKAFGLNYMTYRDSHNEHDPSKIKHINSIKMGDNATKSKSASLSFTKTYPPNNSSNSPFQVYLVSSALAGFLAGTVSSALDVIKTRMQVGGVQTGGMWTVAKQMYLHEGGWRAFTRGMVARVAWIVPSVSISMTLYEGLKDFFMRRL